MTTTMIDHQLANKKCPECDEPNDVWAELLVVGVYLFVRHIPSLVGYVSSTIAQIMDKGYAVHVKKGDFELLFSKDHNLGEANKPEARNVKAHK